MRLLGSKIDEMARFNNLKKSFWAITILAFISGGFCVVHAAARTQRAQFRYVESGLSDRSISVKIVMVENYMIGCSALSLSNGHPLVATLFPSGNAGIAIDTDDIGLPSQGKNTKIAMSFGGRQFTGVGDIDGKIITIDVDRAKLTAAAGAEIKINGTNIDSRLFWRLIAADQLCLKKQSR